MFETFIAHMNPMNLVGIGQLVPVRRQALGVSQGRRAMKGGLLRVTVYPFETGALMDLWMGRLIALADLVGAPLKAHLKVKVHHYFGRDTEVYR